MRGEKLEKLNDFADGGKKENEPPEETAGEENIFVREKEIERSYIPGFQEEKITYGDLFEQYRKEDPERFGRMNIIEFKSWYDEQIRKENENDEKN